MVGDTEEKGREVMLGWRIWVMVSAVILSVILAFRVASWREDAHKYEQAVSDKNTAIEQCKHAQEINNALQLDRDAIAKRLAAAKRMRPSRKVNLATEADPNDPRWQYAADHGGEAGGITTDWLLDYAAQAETYRAERIALEKAWDK